MKSCSSLGYLRINLWHRLMEAIHTAIWTINCISGPRDYRRQMVDRLHLNEGFSAIRGDFLCTYLFPRLWRVPGQCGLSSLQKMELGTGQSGGCTRQPGPEPNFLNVRQNQPLLTMPAVGSDFLCFTALLSDSFVAAFTVGKKGLRFSGLWCLAN